MPRGQSTNARIDRQRRNRTLSFQPNTPEQAARPPYGEITRKDTIFQYINDELSNLRLKTVEMRIRRYKKNSNEYRLEHIYVSKGKYKLVKGKTNYSFSDMSIDGLQRILRRLLDREFKIIEKE